MTRQEYAEIEKYMLTQMQDSSHDSHHVYRVLNFALDIAGHIDAVDVDVLLAACLLHDIGRERQFANPGLCHAQIGGKMAYGYLIERGWNEKKAAHVRDCISSHRYRGDNPPISLEAKILFDADKLDVSGALGVARTLIYQGQVGASLYILEGDENIIVDERAAEVSSFFQEYNYKLKNVYDSFYTEHAKEIATGRQKTAVDFYNGLYAEISGNYENGIKKYIEFIE